MFQVGALLLLQVDKIEQFKTIDSKGGSQGPMYVERLVARAS